jgi:hypothetical protein
MKRMILAVCAALALSGCAALGNLAGGLPPSPAAAADQTTLDEKAVTVAALAVDALAVSATHLVQAGVIEKGSPRALAVADGLDRARRWVNAAAAARRAGNADSYAEALTKAGEALAAVKFALNQGD